MPSTQFSCYDHFLGAAEEEGKVDPAVLVTLPEAEAVSLVQKPGVEHHHPAVCNTGEVQ